MMLLVYVPQAAFKEYLNYASGENGQASDKKAAIRRFIFNKPLEAMTEDQRKAFISFLEVLLPKVNCLHMDGPWHYIYFG